MCPGKLRATRVRPSSPRRRGPTDVKVSKRNVFGSPPSHCCPEQIQWRGSDASIRAISASPPLTPSPAPRPGPCQRHGRSCARAPMARKPCAVAPEGEGPFFTSPSGVKGAACAPLARAPERPARCAGPRRGARCP
ncbi:hypothetical protein E2F46_12675 [Luteimonas aestuarii]|uniref:Uncharacterized protein n=1 Tax=Luteimonas aestuarii TaxID=453837 RepID=A0A4V3ALH0_9GAMM|nr:hypothetical protein E2F46_12675 [Luteimonas aestuarii]